jgi:hypothetical protein
MTYLYKKGYISSDNNYLLFNYSFIRIATTLSIVFFSAFIIRGIDPLIYLINIFNQNLNSNMKESVAQQIMIIKVF